MKRRSIIALAALAPACLSCSVPASDNRGRPIIPAMEYAKRVRQEYQYQNQAMQAGAPTVVPAAGTFRSHHSSMQPNDNRAQLRMVKDWPAEDNSPPAPAYLPEQDMVTNYGTPDSDVYIQRSRRPNVRDYRGPLALGDPGTSPSLWQESRRGNDLFRDERAWQPLDLVTILVSESSEGTKEADTEVKESSTILQAINNLLGFENDAIASNSRADGTAKIDLANLINASSTNDYKGEGDTTRKGNLKATISAMVVEVLPGGILRIEGERIISVNSEEQVMIISGLVRPRDINSSNEVMSSKVANLRIDYYGNGVVGEAQNGGWLSRLVRKIWPF